MIALSTILLAGSNSEDVNNDKIPSMTSELQIQRRDTMHMIKQ